MITFVIIVALVALLCCYLEHCKEDRFEAQPCISDEEFCKLMPEVDPQIALKVREILCDVSGWDSNEIHPETRLVEFEY